MRAGRLRHVVVIQQRTSTPTGAYNEPTHAWSTFATVRAGVEPLRGRELQAAGERQAAHDVRIVIRYLAGLDTTMRVSFGGKYYAILGIVNENNRDRMLELQCVEGLSDD